MQFSMSPVPKKWWSPKEWKQHNSFGGSFEFVRVREGIDPLGSLKPVSLNLQLVPARKGVAQKNNLKNDAQNFDLLRIPSHLLSWKIKVFQDHLADLWYRIWTGFAQVWDLYSLRIPIPRLNMIMKWRNFSLNARGKWGMFWLKVRMFGLFKTLKGNLRL